MELEEFIESTHGRKHFEGMMARLNEIGKDLKKANKKIDSLTNALLKENSKAEKVALELYWKGFLYVKYKKIPAVIRIKASKYIHYISIEVFPTIYMELTYKDN